MFDATTRSIRYTFSSRIGAATRKSFQLSASLKPENDGEEIVPFEPMFSQTYDPLVAPTQITVERDLEDMLMDRSLRFLDPSLVLKKNSEKCYLVGLEDKSLNERLDDTKFTLEESLTELSELAGAAGLEVVGSTYQRLVRY